MTYALSLAPFAQTFLSGLAAPQGLTAEGLNLTVRALSDPQAFQSLLAGRGETASALALRLHDTGRTVLGCPPALRNADPRDSESYLDRVTEALLIGGLRVVETDEASEKLIGAFLDAGIDTEEIREACEHFSREEVVSLFYEALARQYGSEDPETFGKNLNRLAERVPDLELQEPELARRLCSLLDDPRFDDVDRENFIQWVVIAFSGDEACRQAASPLIRRKLEAGAFDTLDSTVFLRLASLSEGETQTKLVRTVLELFDLEEDAGESWDAIKDEYDSLNAENQRSVNAYVARVFAEGGPKASGAADLFTRKIAPNLSGAEAAEIFDNLATRATLTSGNFVNALGLFRLLHQRIPLSDLFDRLAGTSINEAVRAMAGYVFFGGISNFEAYLDHAEEFPPFPGGLTDLQKTRWMVELQLWRGVFSEGTTRVDAGDFTFDMSPVFRDGERLFALAAVSGPELGADEKFRLYYHSKSQGAWRMSPFVERGGFVKGGHYTAVTQLARPLVDYLEGAAPEAVRRSRREWMMQVFDVHGNHLGPDYARFLKEDFDAEFRAYTSPSLQHLTALKPGDVFRKKEGVLPFDVGTLSDLVFPEGFVPDFSAEPVSKATFRHDLLGECDLWTYAGGSLDGRPILWDMAVDGLGRVWIQSIRFVEARVNSFGCGNQFIDAGILQYKPLDYGSQLGRLSFQDRIAFNERYNDISGVLALLSPVRDFIRLSGYAPRGPAFDVAAVVAFDTTISVPLGDLRADLRADVRDNHVEVDLTYSGGYRLSLRSDDGGRHLQVSAEGEGFRYEEAQFGGMGGFEKAWKRFQFCVRRSKNLVFETTDDETEEDIIEAALKAAAVRPNFRGD